MRIEKINFFLVINARQSRKCEIEFSLVLFTRSLAPVTSLISDKTNSEPRKLMEMIPGIFYLPNGVSFQRSCEIKEHSSLLFTCRFHRRARCLRRQHLPNAFDFPSHFTKMSEWKVNEWWLLTFLVTVISGKDRSFVVQFHQCISPSLGQSFNQPTLCPSATWKPYCYHHC